VISRFLCIALVSAALAPTVLARKRDEEIASLIEHAKQLTDIRADGAPAFRLKLNFKVIKKDGSASEGVYSEVWVSKTQWRRETEIGDFRRTQVTAGRKLWVRDSVTDLPEGVIEISALTQASWLRPEAWKTGKVEDRAFDERTDRCVEAQRDPDGGRSGLCFDKNSGLLDVHVTPVRADDRMLDRACFFFNYQKTGELVFPRSYRCDEGRRPRLEATVVELETLTAADPSLFTRLDGGKESVNCIGMVKPPVAVHTEEPEPRDISHSSSVVMMGLTVGIDGKPHDVKISSPPNVSLDEPALNAVRRWTFKPATCDGEAVETQIAVELNFR
jgi:TonB family protein